MCLPSIHPVMHVIICKNKAGFIYFTKIAFLSRMNSEYGHEHAIPCLKYQVHSLDIYLLRERGTVLYLGTIGTVQHTT